MCVLPSLLVVMLTLTEAGSDWLREDTPFRDWTVKVYVVCGLRPQTTTRPNDSLR